MKKSLQAILMGTFMLILTPSALKAQEVAAAAITGETKTEIPERPAKEIISKRDLYSRHYDNGDGTISAYISPTPVHFLDVNGLWQPISTLISNSTREGYAFENKTNLFESYFSQSGKSGVKINTSGETIRLGVDPSLILLDSSFNILNTLEQSGTASPEVKGSAISYKGILPSGDNEFILHPGRIKNNFTLNQLPFLPDTSLHNYLGFSETLELPAGWKIDPVYFSGSPLLTATEINILGPDNKVVANIPLPQTFEKNSPLALVDYQRQPGYLLLNKGGNQWQLITLVPVKWLKEKNRNFPVVIDPTLNFSSSNMGSVYYQDNSYFSYGRYSYRCGWFSWCTGCRYYGSSRNYNYYLSKNYTVLGNSYYYSGGGSCQSYYYSFRTYRVYLQYDISSIPIHQINKVEFQADIKTPYSNGGNNNINITSVSDSIFASQINTFSNTSTTVYNDLANPVYKTFSVTSAGKYGFYDLGTTALSDLNSMISYEKFMIGMVWPYSNFPSSGNSYGFQVDSGILKLTYTACDLPVVTENLSHVSCDSTDDGEIAINLTGGTGPFRFTWSSGDTTQNITGLATGTYHLTIQTGEKNCKIKENFYIGDPNIDIELTPNSNLNTTSVHDSLLNSWLDTVMIGKLLYRGSTHGFSSSTFHSRCDNMGPTLILLRNSTTGTIFGGYNPGSWNSYSGYTNVPGAFLFNLTDSLKLPQLNSGNPYSIYNNSGYGPTFGGGHDLHINSTISGGYSNLSYSYYCPTNATNCREVLTGSNYTFSIDEIEVYELTAINPVDFDKDNDGVLICDDCDDNNPSISTGTDADGDGYNSCVDCNDSDASIYPGAGLIDSASTVVNNNPCQGANNGIIELEKFHPGYDGSILWSTGDTTQRITGLSSGTYTVIYSLGLGCTDSATFVIDNSSTSNLLAGRIKEKINRTYCSVEQPDSLLNDTAGQKGISLTYLWMVSTTGISWSPAPGKNDTAFYIPPRLSENTWFTRAAIDTVCKDTLFSNNLLIEIHPPSTGGIIDTVPAICMNDTASKISESVPSSGGDGSYVYQWQDSTSGNTWSVISGATNKDYQPGILGETTGFRRMTITGCDTSFSNTVLIKVNPLPGGNINASPVCLHDTMKFSSTTNLSTPNKIISYFWDFGNGVYATSPTPGHRFSNSGNHNVSVKLTTNYGCFDTLKTTVIVYSTPTPGFSFSNVCDEDSMRFTNTSSNAVNYSWNFGDGNSSMATDPVHLYGSAGTYSVSLIAESSQGCLDTIRKSVTVYPLPNPSFSTGNECLNDTVKITNNTSGASGYKWDMGDGNIYSSANPSHVYASAGTYKIILTATSIYGCVKKDSQNVTVYPKPVAGFSSVNVCDGKIMSFKNLSTISTGTMTYNWDFGDNSGTSTVENPGYTYSSDGTYRVRLISISAQGCRDTSAGSVTVHPLPRVVWSANNECARDTVRFSNSTSGASSYSWNFGDAAGSTATNPKHVYGTPGNYDVKLIATSSNSCTDSLEKSITIHLLPTAGFSASNVCDNDTMAFINQSSDATTYSWNFGDGNSSASADPKHVFPAHGKYNVQLIAISSNNCKDTLSREVVIHQLPVANFSFSNVCDEDSMRFTNTSSNAVNYSWNFGDGNSSMATDPVHLYGSAGTYSVSLISESSQGCLDTIRKSVTVYPLPNPSFSTGNECLNDTVKITNNTTGASGYKWDMGDGTTYSSANPSHVYASAGTYKIILTATSIYGCVKKDSQNVTVYPKPVALFTTGDQCLDDTVSFMDLSTVTSGSITGWEWDLGNGSSYLTRNVKEKYKTDGNYKITLIAETNYGCKDTFTSAVTVFPKPEGKFVFSTACKSKATYFTDSTRINSGKITGFNWNFGDGGFSSKRNPIYIYSSSGTPTVILMVESDKGCRDTVSRSVKVNPVPTVSFSAQNKCVGDSISFSNGSAIKTGSLTWEWTFGDGNNSQAENPHHVFQNSGYYSVKLVATSSEGCKDSLTKNIQAYGLPSAAFTSSDVCDNDTMKFSNLSSGAASYTWNFGDGNGSAISTPAHRYAAEGKYDVTLIAASKYGCKDTITRNVRVYPLPVADFSAANVCDGQAMAFSNNSTGGNIYSWNFGDGKGSSNASPSHNYAKAGTYTVTLVTESSNNCLDTLQKAVTVYPEPQAAFTAQSVCDGDTVRFNNSTTGAASYRWEFGDGNTSSSTGPWHVYSSPGTYKVVLSTTSANGCISRDSAQVSIYPKPVAAFTFSNACDGKAVEFKDASSLSGGNINYSWDFGDNNGSSSNASPSYTYPGDGRYDVILITATSNGCRDTAIQTVTIYPLPVVSWNASNECTRDTVLFTNNTTGASSFNWTFGDGTTSVSTAPRHVYSQPGTYSIGLKAISAQNCIASLSNKVTIYSLPVAVFSAGNVCDNDTMRFSNLSSGAASYTWNFGDGNGSANSTPAHRYAAEGKYDVTLIATSKYGCKDTITRNVRVYTLPVADFSAANVCDGQPLTFSNNSTGGNIYSWNFGDGKGSSNASPSHTYANAGTYTVTLVTESSNNCLDTLQKAVTVYPEPQAAFTAQSVCDGDTVRFNNSTTGAASYRWEFGDGNTSSSTGPWHVYSSPGTYNVVLTATSANGCISRDSARVSIYPKPVAAFTQEDICAEGIMQFRNGSSPIAENFLWDFSNGTTSTYENPDVHYASAGEKFVSLVAYSAQGCKDTLIKKVTVHPNPRANFTWNDTCAGLPVTITNKSVISGGKFSKYNWNLGNGITSNNKDAQTAYGNPGNYSVTLQVVSDKGCTDDTAASIKIYPNPVADFNWKNVCDGQEMQFAETSNITAGNISFFVWEFGDGNTDYSPVTSNIYGTDGKYDVRLLTYSDQGCTDSVTHRVEVYRKPVADFTAPTVCLGNHTAFINQSQYAETFRWEFGDGSNINFLENPAHLYLNAGKYPVTLITANNDGCKDTFTRTIEVAPLPVANFAVENRCEDKGVSVTQLSSGNITGYNWDFAGVTYTEAEPEHRFPASGTYEIRLEITSSKGCTDSVARLVKIYPLPEIGISPDTTVSMGYAVKLQATGGESYNWSPSASLDDPFSAEPNARPLETTIYSVRISTLYGCSRDTFVTVKVNKDYVLQPTNLITPNGNGKNDTWIVDNIENYQGCKVVIFSQWGTEVFSTQAYQNDWNGTYNGKPLPDGTYYYIISCDGSSYKGAVTILRGENK